MTDLLSQLELDGIRSDAEQLFSEGTVTIERNPEIDSDDVNPDGSINIVRTPLHTNIPARLAPVLSRRDRFDEFGNALVFTRQYRIKVSWDIDDVRIGDYATYTASNDPGAVGREFVVRDVVLSEDNSLRILTVQDTAE